MIASVAACSEPATALMALSMVSAGVARRLILEGRAPAGMNVAGKLDLRGETRLTALPARLTVTHLSVAGCSSLAALPDGLRCFDLDASRTPITGLPVDLQVENRLDLTECWDLVELPRNLRVGALTLAGCSHLTALPEGLHTFFLDISGCKRLSVWPDSAIVRVGRLTAFGCTALTYLPSTLTELAQLDLSGCSGISELPEGLRVTSWLDLGGTEVTKLPDSMAGARVRWNGVLVDQRIVFQPETITGADVLATTNAEVRRTMMERMGLERFFTEVNAQVLDTDGDAGGPRRLLRVSLRGDEDLVCLVVSCPSTGRQYMLRVPPHLRTCRQGAAWVAGFDNEADYAPLAET